MFRTLGLVPCVWCVWCRRHLWPTRSSNNRTHSTSNAPVRQPGDDIHRSLRPARAGRRQPGDAARRAAAFGALQQRLSVQLQPVRHGAGRSARQRAAAIAGGRLHLSNSTRRSASSSAPRRASARFWRNAPTRLARGACRSASRISASLRLGRRPRSAAACRPCSRTTTRQLLGGREDVVTTHQRDRGDREPVDDVRDPRRDRSLRRVGRRADRANYLRVVSSATIQRLGTINPLTHFFRQSNGEVGERGSSPRSATPAASATSWCG